MDKLELQNIGRFGGNREVAIQRDGEMCVRCYMTRTEHRDRYGCDLSVDHIVGHGRWDKKSEVPNNSLDNLQTLCLSCHGHKDGGRQFVKLRPIDVINIRHYGNVITFQKLGDLYGITSGAVNQILHRYIWKDPEGQLLAVLTGGSDE